MNDPQSNELNPEARAIIGRARKSFMLSIGLLVLGFIAIGGALVYRSSQSSGSSGGRGVCDRGDEDPERAPR